MSLNLDIGYNVKKRTTEVKFDSRLFPEGYIKEIRIWCWKKFKYITVLAIFREGKFVWERFE